MKRQEKEQAQPAGKVKQDTKRTYEEEKEWKKKERRRLRRIEEIEVAVSSAEEKISANEESLCDPDVYQDHEKVQTIHAENEALNQELENLLAEWEELSSEE